MRTWTARATAAGAESYQAYFANTLLPSLRELSGFCGAYLARLELDSGLFEVATFTMWDSVEAMQSFTGTDTTSAVVEPEAMAMLIDSDANAINRLVVAAAPEV